MAGRPRLRSSGPAFYTDVTLVNNTEVGLTMSDKIDWYGDGEAPQAILPESQGKIKHNSNPYIGDSQGGIVYTFQDDIKWVVAWSNMMDENNKVYIDITKGEAEIDWSIIQSLLNTSTSKPATVYKYGHVAAAEIDPTSTTPLLNATVKKYED